MKLYFTALLLFCFSLCMAHNSNYSTQSLRNWHFLHQDKLLASFLMIKNNEAYLQLPDNQVVHYPITAFTENDKQFLLEKYATIVNINSLKTNIGIGAINRVESNTVYYKYLLLLAIMIVLGASTVYMNKRRQRYSYFFVLIMGSSGLYSFTHGGLQKITTTTNPSFIDSAFTPFKPNVVTYWDNNYFYVSSLGIPTTHGMMVGISNHGWQQQVPIPQCYLYPNAWSIPLNPVIATNPIPVDNIHFTRGGIAVAVNGIPIFNVHTNTGVDSYVDGQLDNFGGHCGRADDYHYHIAPLHLYNYTAPTQPIAFAFDGFAVYGSVEPDGQPMNPLDAHHGHFGNNGVYHYHGTTSAPYMINDMVGQVTEDSTHQLIPQAAAHPVRPSLTPLNGALITACTSNTSPNGYTLAYTKSSQNYKVSYHWNNNGVYTFYFIGPNNDTTTSVYNGFKPCSLPTDVEEVSDNETISIFPNPTFQSIIIKSKVALKEVFIYDINGKMMLQKLVGNVTETYINIAELPTGMYLLYVNNKTQTASTTFLKQ